KLDNQQQERINHLAELDKPHIQELAHTKTEIETLWADVAAGHRKQRIKATCPMSDERTVGKHRPTGFYWSVQFG
ncbi:lysis system i-spanin subunit Rz, partial [Xenorhabdus innexi]